MVRRDGDVLRSLRVMHGEAAYHSRPGSTAVLGRVPPWLLTCGNTRSSGDGGVPSRAEPGGRWLWPRVIFSNQENFLFGCGKVIGCDPSWQWLLRCSAPAVLAAPPASAGPTVCDYPACTPGIMAHQVLGAPCDNTTYYAFGTADNYVSFASSPDG